ncbi:MAG: DUF86 domain-containing protein [Lentisphaerae bacterium]|nr:DUF86 domain-containing protein [Lentisphaerota bacterium]
MRHNPQKLYEDILRAIDEMQSFCRGKSFADFKASRELQLIVERELEIIGEALVRLRRDHSSLTDHIADIDKIIGLRNVLAHGYDVLEYEILWDVVENKLQNLKRDIQG